MAATVTMGVEIMDQLTQRKRQLTTLTMGLVVGSSGLIWRHGIHLEVFGLVSMFSMLLLWWTLVFKKQWLWWGVAAGLGLGSHQLLLLTIVPQIIWLGLLDKKRLLKILAGIAVGFGATLAGIWVLGLLHHPDSWQIELSLTGLVQYFFRSYYTGYSLETGGELSAYLSRVEWQSIGHSLRFYFVSLWRYWGWWNGLAILGLIFGKKYHLSYWLVLACFLFSGPVLAGYLSVNEPAIVERMYVLSQLYWGLLGGFGLLWMRQQRVWLGLAVLFMVAVYPTRSLAGYMIQQNYIESLFAGLPQNSVLLCLSDVSCFGTYYYQSVLQQRTDVLIIPNADQFRYGRKTAWAFGGFNYPDNPFRLGEAVGRATLAGRPVYAAELSRVWVQELGLDGQAFLAIPDGEYRWIIARPETITLRDCQNDPRCQLRQLSFQVWRNPDDAAARLALADRFERYELPDLAKRERKHAEIIESALFQFRDQNPI